MNLIQSRCYKLCIRNLTYLFYEYFPISITFGGYQLISRGNELTVGKFTNSGSRTKGANEKSDEYLDQHFTYS